MSADEFIDNWMGWIPASGRLAFALQVRKLAATSQPLTAEMVQRAVGKFGADVSWCRALATKLNELAAAKEPRG